MKILIGRVLKTSYQKWDNYQHHLKFCECLVTAMILFLFERDVLALCTNLITLKLYEVFCIIPGFEELYVPAGSGALRSEVIENFAGVCCRIRVQTTIAQYMSVQGIG